MESQAAKSQVAPMPFPLGTQVGGLVFWCAVTFAAASLGTFASINAPEFYRELNRPSWSPPAWVFGPVWTTLYTLMAIAAWLVWRRQGFRGAWVALSLFLVQLALNALWSWLFFAWQLGATSVGEIVLLWLAIAATIFAFWRHSRLAALLLMPYLGWVSYAAALNTNLWLNNPQVLR